VLTQPLTRTMRRPPRSQRGRDVEVERLLAQLRRQVAHLHRLEQTPADGRDVTTSRRTIAELRWRLARLVADHSDHGRSVAA